MTTTLGSQCLVCSHFRSALDYPEAGQRTCSAFAGPIPGEIWDNAVDHRREYPGDNGVRWAGVDGREFPAYALTAAQAEAEPVAAKSDPSQKRDGDPEPDEPPAT